VSKTGLKIEETLLHELGHLYYINKYNIDDDLIIIDFKLKYTDLIISGLDRQIKEAFADYFVSLF